ncbi:hypothetical protein MMC25_003576 [Agyrium rufum]|nr:hypothetical protein [Agyrium rufum]
MSSKLIPKDPESVMVIRNVTPNIITCSMPFNRFGLFKVGGRGTIVRLRNNSLAVFSPTALTPAVRSKVESLGNNVSYLACLDYEHHIFIGDWARAYPSAKVLGVEGLPEKRSQSSEFSKGPKFDMIWSKANHSEQKVDEVFDAEFETEYCGAHGNKELVFCHKPDGGTLITADMIFNLPAYEQYSRTPEGRPTGLATGFFQGLMSAKGSAIWQKRFLWYVAGSADRKWFSESVKRIDGWQFNRMIPCHGDVIEKDAKKTWGNVMEWFLTAKK